MARPVPLPLLSWLALTPCASSTPHFRRLYLCYLHDWHSILSFLCLSGPFDQALEWTSIDDTTRTSAKSAYKDAGISLMVSAFGSTDEPTSSGADAAGTAKTMAAWVKQYGLDGIDVDYEDFNAINAADGKAEVTPLRPFHTLESLSNTLMSPQQWLITFTQTLRAALPAGQYLLTHAPVAPWFSPMYTAGAYTKVNTEVGSLIDWYNVQFYNQGATEYTTCDGLLTASSSTYPSSSVFEINSVAKVDLNKILIGKPVTTADANTGYMSADTLAGCVATAKGKGWSAGVMAWEYPDATAKWIAAVRAQSWPVGSTGGGNSTTTTAVVSTPASPSTSAAAPTTTSTDIPASTVITTTVTTLSFSTVTVPATTSTAFITTTTDSNAPSTTSSAPATATTGTPSGPGCSGAKAWDASTVFVGGDEVTYQGDLWKASWWTEGDAPGGDVGVWVQVQAC